MPFPATRLRRLRATPALRDLVRETRLYPGDLVMPLFVEARPDGRTPIEAMPGIDRLSTRPPSRRPGEVAALGIPAVLLFGIPGEGRARAPAPATTRASSSWPLARSRRRTPTDRDHRRLPVRVHDARPLRAAARRRHVDNDATLELLARTAVSPRRAPAPTSSRRAT